MLALSDNQLLRGRFSDADLDDAVRVALRGLIQEVPSHTPPGAGLFRTMGAGCDTRAARARISEIVKSYSRKSVIAACGAKLLPGRLRLTVK
jgi:hypothetical protein